MYLPNAKKFAKYFGTIVVGTALCSGFITVVSYAANFVISKI